MKIVWTHFSVLCNIFGWSNHLLRYVSTNIAQLALDSFILPGRSNSITSGGGVSVNCRSPLQVFYGLRFGFRLSYSRTFRYLPENHLDDVFFSLLKSEHLVEFALRSRFSLIDSLYLTVFSSILLHCRDGISQLISNAFCSAWKSV